MPTAAFATLGCKVNQYETDRIRESFEERGFAIAPFDAPADVYVVNTCSVTQTAERKSRQMVRRVARQSPGAVVVMTGCMGEMLRLRGDCETDGALVVPNADKLRTLQHVLSARPALADRTVAAPNAPPRPARARTRATLKVQDGCDVHCSFCSIPFTRGAPVSRPAGELVAEAQRLAATGYAEVVVTGVLVGSYGPATGSGGPDLAGLLRLLARVEGIRRVRLSSVEPTQVTDALIAAFAEEPGLCPHLHIPLQSGDTGVLRAMNRPYTRDDYLRLCARVYDRIPDLAITTDIMVGFPGETPAAFDNTLRLAEEVGFARAHVFRYSPRPGTPACDLAAQVHDAEKDARSHRLIGTCRETQRRFVERHLGRAMEVLVEGKPGPDGLLSGYTGNYIRVEFPGDASAAGAIAPVTLTAPSGDGARGVAR